MMLQLLATLLTFFVLASAECPHTSGVDDYLGKSFSLLPLNDLGQPVQEQLWTFHYDETDGNLKWENPYTERVECFPVEALHPADMNRAHREYTVIYQENFHEYIETETSELGIKIGLNTDNVSLDFSWSQVHHRMESRLQKGQYYVARAKAVVKLYSVSLPLYTHPPDEDKVEYISSLPVCDFSDKLCLFKYW